MSPKQGKFIVIEGIDGSGKSTQQRELCKWLREQGYQVVLTHEPGGTQLGENVRNILLSVESRLCDKSELFLFMAARGQSIYEVMLPAIRAGKIVVSGRYFFSSLAYQGFARGLPLDVLIEIAMFATDGLIPDLTILVDMDVKTALSRIRVETFDRIEREAVEFHEKVRSGFLELSENPRWKMKVVDGSKSIAEVHTQVKALVKEVLK
jgi:dTMP kinase